MHSYIHLRKEKTILFPIIALSLCVILSATMVCSRLISYSNRGKQLIIPINQSNGVTKVTAVRKSAFCRPTLQLLAAGPVIVPLDESNADFELSDENTLWEGQTQIEIFRVSYENGEGQVTVNSNSGDKLLAPGTENTYSFTLKNMGEADLDYRLTMQAFFSDGETVIPVKARLINYMDRYLLGSEAEYADVLELNTVDVSDSLSAGYIAPYTLQWQWPFDGDDEYDTWLGNLAADGDITLTIVINTYAEYGGPGGLPDTGDTNALLLPAVGLVGSFGGILVLLSIPRHKREEENAG